MINAMTIDLEDWFCTYNLSKVIKFEDWNNCELRVFNHTKDLLNLFDKYNTKATFFVLGWIAEKLPDLIRDIESRGHEIAIHGYNHKPIFEMTPDQFKYDLEKTLKIITKITKQEIIGYRAPMFSITQKTLWALDILKEYNFKYDSSIFPVSFHPDYGLKLENLSIGSLPNSLIEVPISCVKLLNINIPCGGGGYLRLYPYFVFKKLVEICNKNDRPLIFYLHPWEIDHNQPKINIPMVKKFRHYNNLDKTFHRLEQLLQDFKFSSISNILKSSKFI